MGKQNPGRLIGPPRRTTGTVPGCSPPAYKIVSEMGNSETWDFFERHFGQARLRHYLDACDGDTQRAVQLYGWNAELSAAFWAPLGHLEVALRNTVDRQMTARHTAKGRSGHWIFDEARELGRERGSGGRMHAHPYVDIHTAIRRVKSNKKPLIPEQVISEISFGFWHQMVSKSQMSLWPDIASGFPYMEGRSQDPVRDIVSSLRDFRNRVGHHHRIWALDVSEKYDQIITLAGYIDPNLAAWISQQSRVSEVIARRPDMSTAKSIP